jgi:putative FmdB family regulatory protein
MPTYDYRCDACGHAFEEFQSMTAAPLKKCPECGKPKLIRLIGTGAGIIFKGGGFYETDYRSESYKKAAEAEKAAAKPAEKSDSGGSSSRSGGEKSSGSVTKTSGGAEKTTGGTKPAEKVKISVSSETKKSPPAKSASSAGSKSRGGSAGAKSPAKAKKR